MRTYLLWRTYGVSYLVPGPGTRKIVFLLQFTLDVLSIYRVHPPQESWYIRYQVAAPRTSTKPPTKSLFAALLDCVPGILLLLLLAFLYFGVDVFLYLLCVVVYTIRVIGTKVPGTRCILRVLHCKQLVRGMYSYTPPCCAENVFFLK